MISSASVAWSMQQEGLLQGHREDETTVVTRWRGQSGRRLSIASPIHQLLAKKEEFMQRMRLFLFCAVVVTILAGITVLEGTRAVLASTAQHSNPQVTCSGNGCNGKDPIATGCAAGAYTVQTGVLLDFLVQLRYSPRCGTNWGRVISRIGSAHLFATVQRIDGLSYTRSFGFSTLVFSQMVYAPTVKARACGRIGSSVSSCTAFV